MSCPTLLRLPSEARSASCERPWRGRRRRSRNYRTASTRLSSKYSRRISGIPDNTIDVENTDAIVKKVGEAIGVTITDEMSDWSHCVGRPCKMGTDVLVKFTSYRCKHLIIRARSGLKNKDAARLGLSPAGGVRQPESDTQRSRVAARARQLKRDKKIKDTWVRDGEIYVKKNDRSTNKMSTSRQLDVFG